ncbi:MAG: hypothetical protein ACE5D6_06435 [Candidatus Zixiibacteriota bacterium]
MISSIEIDERIDKCQKILNVDPNSQIFAALANAYRKKGDLEKAFRICQNGLKIHPSYGSAHIVMAKVNLDRGLFDWAEVEVKKAIEIDGHTRTIELLLAEIYIYKGEFGKAIKSLKQMHQANPNNLQIQKLLEIARKIPEEQTIITSTSSISSEEKEKLQTGHTSDSEGEADRVLNAKGIIDNGMNIPGVDGILMINFEGLVIESNWTLNMDLSLCGASLSDIGNLLNKELVKCSFGNFNTILIEVKENIFYLNKVHNGLFLFVANGSANLGSLRMKVENLLALYQ